jgi:hypothetical protein
MTRFTQVHGSSIELGQVAAVEDDLRPVFGQPPGNCHPDPLQGAGSSAR